MSGFRVAKGDYAVWGLFILYLLVLVAWAGTGPKVWVDEPWVSIPAYRLVTAGELDNPVMTGVQGRGEQILSPSLTYVLSLAASFKTFGVGVFQGRLVSALAMFAAALLAYRLARRCFGAGVALLAAALLMVNNIAFVSAATIRAEAMVALATMAAAYLFVRGTESGRTRLFVLSGLVMGFGLHTHPNAFLGLAGLVVLFLVRFGFGALARRPIWSFAGGVLLGVLPYAVYVFAADADNDFRNFLAQISGRAKPLAEENYLVAALESELRRYAQYVFFPKRALIAVLEGAALVYALFSRQRALRLLGVLVAVHLVLFPVLIVNKTARYFTVLMPFVSILVAKLLADLAGAPRDWADLRRRLFRGPRPAVVAVLLGLLYFGNQFAGDAWLAWRNRNNDYDGFIAKLEEHIPDGARVWGSMTYWFGLREHPFRSQYTYGKDIETFRPEYVILYDGDTWGNVSGTTGRRQDTAFMDDTKRILEDLAARRGTFVARVKDAVYGEVEIQRIDWSDGG